MTPNLTAFTGVDSQNLPDVMVSVQFILAIGDDDIFEVVCNSGTISVVYLSISYGGLSTMTPTSKKYIVKLTDDELKRLNKILRQKNTSETVANRIRILKDMDANANFPGFYNSMSKKPTITAFFEV
ncbi:hypothetical protein [Lactobacillus delbrueckii]|uniref:hypothetical protein n=2 Tax=Lactobacillus delbrueckii TaxID=1584 RepID=UPI001485F6EC|nr:hypothetical protein [Lactobacillus delbrueckii]